MTPLFSISGPVIRGNQLGKKLGYPTANLGLTNASRYYDRVGVYAAVVVYQGIRYSGMANIGFRPTLDLPSFTVEVNIFDFDRDIYGEVITIHFLHRLRNEAKYDSLHALVHRIRQDETEIRKILLQLLQADPNAQ